MKWLSELLQLVGSWWRVDAIRTAPYVGRLGTLKVGDRIVYRDRLFHIDSQLDYAVSENRCEVLWRLEEQGTGEADSRSAEFRVLARSYPDLSLRGYFRCCDPVTGVTTEEEMEDHEIVQLGPDSMGTLRP